MRNSEGNFTYTVPAGVVSVDIKCWGGGAKLINGNAGGGGGGASDNGNGGGGSVPGGGGVHSYLGGYSSGNGANGAVWVTYTTMYLLVNFNAQVTGTSNMPTANQQVPYNTVYGDKIVTTTPTSPGYVFKGWYFNASCTQAYSSTDVCTRESDFTLYAKWFKPGSISGTQTVCKGASVSLSNSTAASGNNGTLSYQWQVSTDEGNTFQSYCKHHGV